MTAHFRAARIRPANIRPANIRAARIRPARIAAEAMAFQADLDRLVAEPAPLILRLWPLLGAALVAALVAAAALARVDVVVMASGRLATDAPPVILQPMSRAVLRDLLVHPGDVVVEGQVLARLDPTLTDADRASLAAQVRALSAEQARLLADMAGLPVVVTGAETALQADVQRQRAAQSRAQRAELEAELAALQQAQVGETAAGAGLTDRMTIATEIAAMRDELAQRQSGSHLQALEARLDRLDAKAAYDQHLVRLAALGQSMTIARSRLRVFDLDLRRKLTEDLAALQPRLTQVSEALAKADRLVTLSSLIAPRAGVVLSVAAGGPGSVMAENDPVVVLSPTDVPLVAEIGIASGEVGTIAIGDVVSLKVDAFPWRRHGTMDGVLIDISRASFTPQGGTVPLHAGRIALKGGLQELPLGTMLLPGMTLSAEIKTGSRSVLDYFIDPLMRGLRESLREP